jgi:hypothetical protein
VDHGAKLDDVKIANLPDLFAVANTAFGADPFLGKEGRARRIQLDQQRNEETKRP